MRTLLAAGALALTSAAHAAAQEDYALRTAGELARVCATPSTANDHATAIALCHGFLAGSYAYYLSATPAAQRFVCEPSPMPTRTKIGNDFVGWMKAHPQFEKDSAVDGLFRFASESFPCKR